MAIQGKPKRLKMISKEGLCVICQDTVGVLTLKTTYDALISQDWLEQNGTRAKS